MRIEDVATLLRSWRRCSDLLFRRIQYLHETSSQSHVSTYDSNSLQDMSFLFPLLTLKLIDGPDVFVRNNCAVRTYTSSRRQHGGLTFSLIIAAFLK